MEPAPAHENSGDNSEPAPDPRLANLKPFQPGQSGNPKGRPKGLARKVREITGDNDGETIARFWVAAMSGQLPNPLWDSQKTAAQQPGVPQYVVVDAKDRLVASRLLAERGWGKPPAFAPMEDDDPLDFAEREAEEVAVSFDARMDELAERRRARDSAAQAAG